ncbi:hypothetical protein NVP1188A_33 [Vibrio phage 1.188.A._10N.286.51.A6]|uniref:Uncharacterized protein n=3 Tax=Mukerjeevirus mv51A6 TaxID=2734162 RepID=A0A2I7RIX9_9CAUD|nr:hypothetical protein HOU77_gp73 [Vibrio phage 1.188.A._10N.286.51.A6]AUR93601.1 hypothetical protein NVP1188A_33 [Vibrio phage 1.188.A._10N.286.51.A6]AUR93687.1 hypothetical protein NVP1188B_33 [Vibrio phage 1.188.B._10N.286.51.A6]AUR93773.1 hypothetical protein NVP1188C_33 [Vibrio phage 1.188.C._10N.286.51.A6]
MTVLAVLSELECQLDEFANLNTYDPRKRNDTEGNGHEADWTRKAFGQSGLGSVGGENPWLFKVPFSTTHSGDKIWFHIRKSQYDSGYNLFPICLLDASDNLVFLYKHQARVNHMVETNSISEIICGNESGSHYTWDFCLDFAADTITCFRDEEVYAFYESVGIIGLVPDKLALPLASSKSTTIFNEMIIADEQTVGWKIKTIHPDTAGTSQEWTGTAADVNTPVLDETTSNYTESAGAQTYVCTPADSPNDATGYTVKCVVSSSIATSSSPALITYSNAIKINGTVHSMPSRNIFAKSLAGSIVDYIDVNPDTGEAWTLAEINAAEFGFKVE